MITAVGWVPRGRASRFPKPFEVSPEDAAEMEKLSLMHLNEVEAEDDSDSSMPDTQPAPSDPSGAVPDRYVQLRLPLSR